MRSDRALDVLRMVQWHGPHPTLWECPACSQVEEDGHTKECELAAAIRDLEAAEHEARPSWVEKFTGDYAWGGWLVSTFRTPDGHTRHAVAHPVDRGHVLHIYSPANIRPAERPSSSIDPEWGEREYTRLRQAILAAMAIDPAEIRRAALEDAARVADMMKRAAKELGLQRDLERAGHYDAVACAIRAIAPQEASHAPR